jgi:predicted NAD-dependent protein-ADP-ribosyltransferase YbiA (DUF1768 family)
MSGTKEEQTLYRRLIHVAIAQSGLTVSPISFTSLLPYEDFKLAYGEVISLLENQSNLDNFNQVNAFQRINFRNSKIVPVVKAFNMLIGRSWEGKVLRNLNEHNLTQVLKDAVDNKVLPRLMEKEVQSQYGDSDVVLYSYQDLSKTKAELIKIRKANDYSYIHKVLMKRVYEADGITPYISSTKITYGKRKGEIINKYLYKAINAWGDGIHANELYDKLIPEDEDSTIGRPSVFENGMDKVQKIINGEIVTGEVEDKAILDILKGTEEKTDILDNKEIPKNAPINELLNKPINIYSGTGDNTNLSNFAKRPFVFEGRKYASVEHAYQTLKSGKFDEDTFKRPGDFVGTKRNAPKNVNRNISVSLMEKLMKASFEQNPLALQELLNTGNSPLIHIGGDDTFWEANFPKVIMKVRNELGTIKNTPLSYDELQAEIKAMEKMRKSNMTLKDGKTYTFSRINSKMLEAMKYSPVEIGEILKSIC